MTMRNHPRLLASTGLVAALVVAWAAGCGSTDSGAQATLGPAGGTLSVPGTGVELLVPAGALDRPVGVSMTTARDTTALTVAIEPRDLALARPATLSVTLSGPVHFSGVTEVSSGMPVGLDARIESSTSAVARLTLDHLRHVRFSTDVADGGVAPGACREHEDGEHRDGEHEDGEHEDGDGGHHDGDGGHHGGDGRHHDGEHGDGGPHDRDAGVVSMACPAGFECDDGVCVLHGGNDEHRGECDGGRCHDDDDDDDDGRDAGHP
jgi:hypothetical protein